MHIVSKYLVEQKYFEVFASLHYNKPMELVVEQHGNHEAQYNF